MSYKTVTTVLVDTRTDQTAFEAAIDLCRREHAHLEVICLGIDQTQPGFYYMGANAVALQTGLAEAENRAKALEEFANKLLHAQDINWTVSSASVMLPALPQFLAHRTRLSDVVVLPQPYGENRGHAHEAVTEAELFEASIPVFIIPDGGALANPVRRVVIAWNDSQEALTAIRAALPLLRAAETVNIAIVDPPAHAPDRSDPGGALSLMLSRHDVRADVSVLAKTLPRVSDVIARHLADQEADLLVMGAYGHSRLRESILGGATRHLLQITEVPIFMAH